MYVHGEVDLRSVDMIGGSIIIRQLDILIAITLVVKLTGIALVMT